MSGIGLEIGLVVVLMVVNAAFAGSEVALISLREGQLRRMEAEGGRGRLVAELARDPTQFLSTVQIGITLAGFLASAVAAVSLARPLVQPLGFLGRWAEPAAVVAITVVLTFTSLVAGELAPKRIALQRSEGWARAAARPLAAISVAARPLLWLLSVSSDALVRLAGVDPAAQREPVTEEEVRDMIATQPSFPTEQRTILVGALELTERRLREVLVPRRDVVALPADLPVAEAVRRMAAAARVRAPVYRGDLDDVAGVANLVDLVDATGRVGDHCRPATALPESLTVLPALRRMQRERQPLAIVINEYGGTEGIVTVEDLLEELVGELSDEFDRDVADVRREPDGSLVLPGSFPVHDLPDVGVDLPEGPYATVAGLVLDRLGRIPAGGETVTVGDWLLEVLEVDRNTVERLRLRPRDGAPDG
jgi:magnesium and cobalt exporter, CNNM family